MTCWCVSENLDSLEVHILSGGSKLQIARSQLLDSGTYTCIASNPEGKAQKTYVLSIQGKKWGRVWGRELVEHWVSMALSVLGTLRSHHHIEKWRIWPVTFVTRGESGWRIQYFWFKICMEKNILKAWLWILNRVVQAVCVCCWSRPSFSWALELPWLAAEQHSEMDSGAVVPIVPWEELAKTYCRISLGILPPPPPQIANFYLLWNCLLPCCESPLVCNCCVFLCS